MVIKLLKNYFLKHKGKLVLIIASILIVTFVSLAPQFLIKIVVDEMIPNHNLALLFIIACFYMSSNLLIGICNFIKNYLLASVSQDYLALLKKKMMNHYSKIKYSYLTSNSLGEYESIFNNDVNSLNELFTTGVMDMVTDFIKIIAIIISLFIYSLTFGFIVFLILPVIILFTLFVRKKMLYLQSKNKKMEAMTNQVLLENVNNIEDIKVFKGYDYSENKYVDVLKENYKTSKKSNFYDGVFSPMIEIFRSIVICVVLLISGIKPDFFSMSIGMIISSIGLVSDLFSPIGNLGMEIQTIQKSIASYNRINNFFKLETKDECNINEVEDYRIMIKNCSFAYDKTLVLNDFTLDINKNERIVLKGPSGRGKSTLMKLIMGLMKPNSGNILIGGKDAYLFTDNLKVDLFSIVFQNPLFSGGTIYEEVSLLDCRITKEEVRKALNDVGLAIDDIDATLESNKYSSGELQLFNIARVIVKKTKIIFLDEMNANIDPITCRNIIRLIDDLCKNNTIISINHYGEMLSNSRVINL